MNIPSKGSANRSIIDAIYENGSMTADEYNKNYLEQWGGKQKLSEQFNNCEKSGFIELKKYSDIYCLTDYCIELFLKEEKSKKIAEKCKQNIAEPRTLPEFRPLNPKYIVKAEGSRPGSNDHKNHLSWKLS